MTDEETILGEDDLIPARPLRWRVVRVVGAVVATVGILYLSGGHQYLSFRRTSLALNEPVAERVVVAPTVEAPLTVWVLRNDESGGSERTQAEVDHLVGNAAAIWEQANARVSVVEQRDLAVTVEELRAFRSDPEVFVGGLPGYDLTTINVFLLRAIGGGINGLALGEIRAVLVSDYTTVPDFRTLAHEIGHILGLAHVAGDRSRLMYRGANGITLSPEEIEVARARAVIFVDG